MGALFACWRVLRSRENVLGRVDGAIYLFGAPCVMIQELCSNLSSSGILS